MDSVVDSEPPMLTILSQSDHFQSQSTNFLLHSPGLMENESSQGWRETMEKEIMRSAIEKFADELDVEQLKFRTMIREEMVRVVSEKLLQEGAKEIELVKQQQLRRMLQKVQAEEATLWRGILNNLILSTQTDGRTLNVAGAVSNHIIDREVPLAEKFDGCVRDNTSLNGCASTPSKNIIKHEVSQPGTSVGDKVESHRQFAGNFGKESSTELPLSTRIFSSADLEPDKERKQTPKKRNPQPVYSDHMASWQDRVEGSSSSSLTESICKAHKCNTVQYQSRNGGHSRHCVHEGGHCDLREDIIFEGEQLKGSKPIYRIFRRVRKSAGDFLRGFSFRSQLRRTSLWLRTACWSHRRGQRVKKNMKTGHVDRKHVKNKKTKSAERRLPRMVNLPQRTQVPPVSTRNGVECLPKG